MKKDFILCIETSGSETSVCLIEGTNVVSSLVNTENNSAASKLNLMIQDLLHEAKVGLNDIAAVALSGGPGSYTGLRIGAATAKGICYALKIPLIHISTLQIMAASVLNQATEQRNKQILSAMDARNGNYYVGLYDLNLEEAFVKMLNINDTELNNLLKNELILTICNAKSDTKKVFHINDLKINASNMTKLAAQHYKKKNFSALDYYEPKYLTGFFKEK